MRRARCSKPRTKRCSAHFARKTPTRRVPRSPKRPPAPPAPAARICRAREAWTDSFMRCSKSLASAFVVIAAVVLAGCGALAAQQPGALAAQQRGALAIRSARVAGAVDAPVLELAIDCRLSGPMQDALDHGIPLTFRVSI